MLCPPATESPWTNSRKQMAVFDIHLLRCKYRQPETCCASAMRLTGSKSNLTAPTEEHLLLFQLSHFVFQKVGTQISHCVIQIWSRHPKLLAMSIRSKGEPEHQPVDLSHIFGELKSKSFGIPVSWGFTLQRSDQKIYFSTFSLQYCTKCT